MSVELNQRLEQAAGSVDRGPDVQAAMHRGNRLRRRRRQQTSIGSLCLVLVAVGGATLVVQQPDGPDIGPIGGQDAAMAVLEEPAASDRAFWPLRMVYEQRYPAGYSDAGDPGGVAVDEFVGTSWNNWQVTQLVGSRAGEIVDRKHGEIDRFTENWDDPDAKGRAPSRDLNPGWYEPGWSLQQVDLEAVPASSDVLDRLGLAPHEVRAFASPAVVECRQAEIKDCPDTVRESVRALAHLDSGLLLFRETVYEGEPMFTYVVTQLGFSDPDAVPAHGRAG